METVQPKLGIESLPVADLFADPEFNCRGFISPLNVTDLAQSMKARGLQQPIIVQPWTGMPGKTHRVVIGHRRHKSAEILGWTTIPCIVRHDLDEAMAMELNFIENIQRENLNMVQEANAIQRFVSRGVTQVDIANMVKQSRGWVQVRIALLELPGEIQTEAAAGRLTVQQIRDIRGEHDREKQYAMVRLIKDRKANGEKTPRLVKPKPNLFAKKRREREEIFNMIEHIGKYLGYSLTTRVLAWASGEIADIQVYSDIRKQADEQGVFYEMPAELRTAACPSSGS